MQTGSDTILALDPDDIETVGLQPDMLRPMLRGRDVRAFHLSPASRHVLFPYDLVDDEFVLKKPKQIAQYPTNLAVPALTS